VGYFEEYWYHRNRLIAKYPRIRVQWVYTFFWMMRGRFYPVSLLILSSVVWSGRATADTLTPFSGGETFLCLIQSGSSGTAECPGSSPVSGTATASTTLTGVDSELGLTASGSGGFGSLHASASTILIVGSTPTAAAAIAYGVFEDILTINFEPFTGEEGFLLLNYTLDGTTAAVGIDNAFGEVGVAVGPDLEQQYNSPALTGSVVGDFAVPMTFTFTYGQPFGIEFVLTAASGTADPSATGLGGFTLPYVSDGTGGSLAGFGDTLILSGITVEDPSGNTLDGAQITSASGTQYGPDGILPEPSSAVLLALGLSIICVARTLTARTIGLTPLVFPPAARWVPIRLWVGLRHPFRHPARPN
jgi:hypothetical protein